MAFFNALVRYELGDGSTFWYWLDPWLQGQCLADIAPDLLAMIPTRCKKRRTVRHALHGNT
jgi:N-glycosylase/DNA lyase